MVSNHGNRRCLNPYSNGIYSWSGRPRELHAGEFVLILILMEYTLGDEIEFVDGMGYELS